MTREEAIDLLDNLIGMLEDNHNADYDTALKMAIKSLEQEPCEDCISRQAVINGIDNYIEKVQSTGAKDDFISFEELVVKALPSVTPKAKVGKWIESHIPESVLVECSECGFSCGASSFNYCHNCGAKMEGENKG